MRRILNEAIENGKAGLCSTGASQLSTSTS